MTQAGNRTQRVATLHDLMVELGKIELELERMPSGKPDVDALKTRRSELRCELAQLSR
ncbi:MAG: hypothetical protein AAF552_18330 [Pseudomonadota bacterium]